MREAHELSIQQIRQMREMVKRKIENNDLLASEIKTQKTRNKGQLLPDSEIKQKLLDKFDEMSSKPIAMDDHDFSGRVGQYILIRVPHYDSLYPFHLAKGDICYTVRPMKAAKVVYKQSISKPRSKPELEQIQVPKIEADTVEHTQIEPEKEEPKIELELPAETYTPRVQQIEEPPKIEEVKAAFVDLAKNLEEQPTIELQVETGYEYADLDDEQQPQLEHIVAPQNNKADISTNNQGFNFISKLKKSGGRKIHSTE